MNDMNEEATTSESNGSVYEEDNRETVGALDMVMAQIKMSLNESAQAMNNLISAITEIVCSTKRIDELLANAEIDDTGLVESINEECGIVDSAMLQAVAESQFYYRLSQRIEHVHENLSAIKVVIEAPEKMHHAMWEELHEKVRALYSQRQEQLIVQSMLDSNSRKSAILDANANKGGHDDIELF